jgi:hypothetical protein
MWKKLFLEHPETVGESYSEHFFVAMSFSIRLGAACLMCAIHALLPFLFTKTGSKMITELHDDMVSHRDRSAGVKKEWVPDTDR